LRLGDLHHAGASPRREAFAYERHTGAPEKTPSLTALIPIPYPAGPKLRGPSHEVIRANKVTEVAARIYLSYTTIGFWQIDAKSFRRSTSHLHRRPPRAIARHRVASPRENGRHAASLSRGVKKHLLSHTVWSVDEAVKEGFDEVSMLNERGGEACRITSANIFAVKKTGKVLTPPLNSAASKASPSASSMEIARTEPRFRPGVRRFVPKTLYTADEVSSLRQRNLIIVAKSRQSNPHSRDGLRIRLTTIFSTAYGRLLRLRCRLTSSAI